MVEIGKFIQQPEGYKAFIPSNFPPSEKIQFSDKIILKQNPPMNPPI